MNARITLATAGRVLTQLRHDHRTIALLLIVPCLLLALLSWVFDGEPAVFDRIGPLLLAIFPLVVMFIVTSVAMLRERTSGTLERLLTMPMNKLDLLLGYAVAFGVLAVVQAGLAGAVSLWLLGLDIVGSAGWLLVTALLSALLGTALGLLASAFAQTEFQAVQFMPAFVLPQLLLCGLFVPREAMQSVLSAASNVLPLSYAVDAMAEVAASTGLTAAAGRDFLVLGAFIVGALVLGAATLRRRTA
ncbi:MAG: ABC transporter permease [Geodermatophilaceae bacterium]|nr:ABC transporter permease [Geodermatophilaceae bacterium]